MTKPADNRSQPAESPKPPTEPQPERETAQEWGRKMAELMVAGLNRRTSQPDPHDPPTS